MLASGTPAIQDHCSNAVETIMATATEDGVSLMPGEMIEHGDGGQRDEAGLTESSKAIVAAMLGQDDPDGTDAAVLMMMGDGTD